MAFIIFDIMSDIKSEPNRQILWENSYSTSKFAF